MNASRVSGLAASVALHAGAFAAFAAIRVGFDGAAGGHEPSCAPIGSAVTAAIRWDPARDAPEETPVVVSERRIRCDAVPPPSRTDVSAIPALADDAIDLPPETGVAAPRSHATAFAPQWRTLREFAASRPGRGGGRGGPGEKGASSALGVGGPGGAGGGSDSAGAGGAGGGGDAASLGRGPGDDGAGAGFGTPGGPTRGPGILGALPAPPYPARARSRGWEGRVVLAIATDPHGRVTGVEVAESSGKSELDTAARDAALRWTFAPALEDGVPVSGSLRVPVRFVLTN